MTTLAKLMGSGVPGAQAQATTAGIPALNLTAAGTTQANATAITSDFSVFSTVPASSGARLPAQNLISMTATAGDIYVVINASATTMLVYPPLGGSFANAAASASLSAGQTADFYCLGNNAWAPSVGGTSSIFAEDDFIGTNGTFVESRPTNIGNKTWTTNAAGAFTLNGSGKVNATIQANANTNVFDAGVSDFTITCSMSSFTPDNNHCVLADLIFRYVDAGNFWGVEIDPRFNKVVFYNKTGGSQFVRMFIIDATVVSNAITAVRVDCMGANITVWVNGVQIASVVDTFNQTATKCGIYMGVNGPSGGNATWGPIAVVPAAGLKYNWPAFVKNTANAGAPVIPKGTAGTWNATDLNNPTPFYDAVNSRWAMLLSGYTAAAHSTNGNAPNSSIQNLGLWTSTTIDGPWTAYVSNPVMLANGTDGVGAFNGGAVQIGGTTYQAYVSDNGTTIRWATSTDLINWTRVGLIASSTVPTSLSWKSNGVFDPMLRVRQGSNIIEMWCAGVDGAGTKRFGLLTSNDLGTTWVDQTGTIPAVLPPTNVFVNSSAGEPSVYVPPGKEGQQYLIAFDYVPTIQSGNPPVGRYIGQGISLDGGQTWAWRIEASKPGTYAWENLQDFDSFMIDVGDGNLRLFNSGADTYGPALGLNIQIGEQSAPWGKTSLVN